MTEATPSHLPGRNGEGDEAYESPPNLTGTVFTSLKWTVSSRLIRDGTRFAVGVLLAHKLTPEEWGIAGMALVVVAFLSMLTDMGLAAALVQQARITEADRSTLFWASLILGLTVTLLAIAVSGVVASFFGEPEVQSLFAVASVTFAIYSLEKVPGTLLTRELAFRALEIRQITATVAGAVVALALAIAGAGAWAIIANAVATAAVSCTLLWFMTSWRPRLEFDFGSFRRMTRYGGSLLASQLLTYFQLNTDKLLIGRYIGAAPLGNYQLATQLMFTPIGNISYPLQGVFFPVLSTIQDDPGRMTAAWLRGKRLAVTIMAPLFMTLFVVAPDLVPALFGSKWDDSIPVLQLLCLGGVAHSLSTLNWSLLMAKDQLGTLFRLTVLTTAVVVGAVVTAIVLDAGIVGVAGAFSAAFWILVIPEIWMTARAGSIPFWPALRATCAALPFVAVASVIAYASLALIESGTSSVVRIVVSSVVLITVYVAVAFAGSRPLRAEIRQAIRRLRRRRSK